MRNIIIPNNIIKYILFQRTGYLKNNKLFKLLSIFGSIKLLHKPCIFLKGVLFSRKIKGLFTEELEREYSVMKPFLSQKIKSVLDIGCGVGGIDILLSRHYENNINIHLLDKTQIDQNIYYKYEDKGSFYNSLESAKNFLHINGIEIERIYLQEATQENQVSQNNFDLVISLISWGFHYPVSTYLDTVYEKLEQNGIMIIDVRKNTNGEKEIENKFGNCKIIYEAGSFNRVLAKKVNNAEIV
jgi:SAM-dependent methyltransferase